MNETDDTPIPDYANALRLDGRGVMVIGAGQGIGRQTAHAASALGAKVACVDLHEGRARAVAGETGGTAIFADATKRQSVEDMFDEATAALGRIHAIVDILGMPKYQRLTKTQDEDWDFQMDITLRQAFYILREGGRIMGDTGGGAMVFVSSVSGLAGAPMHAPYGAAKAGLNSLVRSAAVELGPRNIRVNSVAPGVTLTPRVAASMSPEARDAAATHLPLRRLGKSSDIAAALVFMISDQSAYITGQTLTVDGGATATFPLQMRPLK